MTTPRRAAVFVFLLAVAAYANSITNDFAYDDDLIVAENPTVQEGAWREALARPWWPESVGGAGLYRPFTSASFALEWGLFGGDPAGFHAINVLGHATVSLLVFLLLLDLAGTSGAAAGGVLFAIHPVHTEAVANVVGRAEVYAALFYLLACLLYLRGRAWTGAPRALRLVALGVLYLLSLSSKEIGVTLPAALLLLELASRSAHRGREAAAPDEEASVAIPAETVAGGGLAGALRREAATYLLLAVVLGGYLTARFLVLGTVAGDKVAPVFEIVGPFGRVLTAVGLWLQYARLLLFPLDLVADYDPGVLFPSEAVDGAVFGGLAVVGLLAVIAVRSARKAPLVTAGVAFFAVALLPVSNLLFATGTVLAERTLYLPSVGLSMLAAGVVLRSGSWPHPRRRALLFGAVVVGVALFARTVARNPSWYDTFTVQRVLAEEHPESWRAFQARALGLVRVGDEEAASAEWERAVTLAPTNYTLLVQAAGFHDARGEHDRAEAYLRRALEQAPDHPNPYQHLALHLLRRGQGREGHAVALTGLARAGSDAGLWALVSESYVMKGDLEAAIRARRAAVGADPDATGEWGRLADLLLQAGDTVGATEARERSGR